MLARSIGRLLLHTYASTWCLCADPSSARAWACFAPIQLLLLARVRESVLRWDAFLLALDTVAPIADDLASVRRLVTQLLSPRCISPFAPLFKLAHHPPQSPPSKHPFPCTGRSEYSPTLSFSHAQQISRWILSRKFSFGIWKSHYEHLPPHLSTNHPTSYAREATAQTSALDTT